MAGGQERILRRRIKSVQATRKITKAMELIAASQIARSQARIAANRPYRAGMQRIIREAALADLSVARKMMSAPEKVETALVVVLAGDRGLSGPYNSSVLRAGERLIHMLRHQGTAVRLITVGKKAEVSDARVIAAALAAPFVAGEVQQVMLVSTRFISAGSQVVESEQLLPLSMPEDMEVDTSTGLKGYTEFEPEVEELLVELAPKALESEIFAALLEGAASFQTSQQRAMAAATDNADELGQTLTRIMNRARQDSITTEIMEIVSGAEALRSGK